jgi:chaperonin GroEL
MPGAERATRRVFVIMPFVEGGSRNEAQLTAFFENNIKRPIEGADLRDRYEVYRSGQTFDINAEIIRDLCRADIVIADLSGADPNPNVMYELGVRLAISAKPVILIREQHPDNRRIFDIYGFYTHAYDPYDYRQLERHLIEKLKRWEAGDEPYTNPVLNIINVEMAQLSPSLTDVAPEQQRELALHGVQAVAAAVERAYGPYGIGLGVESRGGSVRLEKRGLDIARAMHSANPFEEAGIRLMAGAAIQLGERIGDGSKLPVIIARALVEGCIAALNRGVPRRSLLDGITAATSLAIERVRGASLNGQDHARAVAFTASHGPSDVDVVTALNDAGPNGYVSVEEADGSTSSIETVAHMVFERGAIHPAFVADCPQGRCVLENCALLFYTHKISSMKDLLPVLEEAAKAKQPLLLLARDVEGEALATLVVNLQRGTLRCIAVRAPGLGDQTLERLHDLAILTGGKVLDAEMGFRLENAGPQCFGRADKVIVSAQQTEIIGGRGNRDAVDARVKALRNARTTASPHDSAILSERIARLAGAVVTVYVGATTPQEQRDKRYRVLSALNATSAALTGGCVPGGGRMLQFVSEELVGFAEKSVAQSEGIQVARAALVRPLHATVVAAGFDPSGTIEHLNRLPDPRIGFNAQTGKIEDLVVAGILDPTDTIVHGLEVAQATARTFLETGAWHIQPEATDRSTALEP